MLESREQILKTELASLQTDLVELRQRLDDQPADTGPSAPDETDGSQANDPQYESVLETAAPTASLYARSVDVLSEASLVEPETLIPPSPDRSASSPDATADLLDGLIQTDLSGYLLRPVDVDHEQARSASRSRQQVWLQAALNRSRRRGPNQGRASRERGA